MYLKKESISCTITLPGVIVHTALPEISNVGLALVDTVRLVRIAYRPPPSATYALRLLTAFTALWIAGTITVAAMSRIRTRLAGRWR